jgi:predicted DNA-binding transcriptional regulator YafY
MPINKDALVRYRVINRCLISKTKKFPTKEELQEACQEALGLNYISLRTIVKDLEDMRYNEELGFIAPIEYSKKQKGYFYSDPNYSTDKIPLKENDLNALRFAAGVLNQFSQISMLKDFSGTVSKILEAVNINRILSEESQLDFIEFDKAEHIPGGPMLEKIVNAIQSGNQIHFSYKKHGSNEIKSYILEPYLLKQFKNIWYIIGREPDSEKIKTFGLDRVLEVEELAKAYTIAEDFDRKKYFKHSYGITSYHGEPDEIVLQVKRKAADYIKALPLHSSQEILNEDDQYTEIKLLVYPTYDFLVQLLSYGSNLKVLKPESLKNSIIATLEETLALYKK